MAVILEMKNITKAFPGVLALDDVSLELNHAEILALLGENGAGKSTLIKILGGAQSADHGEIILDGQKLTCSTPAEMIAIGIAVMHQELNYLDDLSIAENIFLGNLPVNKLGQVDYKKLKADTKHLLDMVGLLENPMKEVSLLSIAQKQMIEIAKVLSRENCKVLVMDEPTSALNEAEVATLFKLMRELTAKGISIIYISHKIKEIFEISDRIQVLRDGRSVGMLETRKATTAELITMMVGRSIENMYPKIEIPLGEVVLEVEHLCGEKIKDVSFQVHAGEVVGLFGLMGAGRTEIAESIFGKRQITSGIVKVNGKVITKFTPRQAIKAGIAYIPRERKSDGLVMTETVKNNMILVFIDKISTFLHLKGKEERRIVKDWVDKLQIKTPSINTPIESLSGGNQQKVVIGKWLIDKPKVMILNEPTRGIDVGAKVEVYKLIEELCQDGIGILLISSETPEIMGISDQIFVVREGMISGECLRCDFDQENIMHYAVRGELP